ncbi:MAG: hypothetical protein U1E49_13590 [Hyphomicrobiaceae bacterium]
MRMISTALISTLLLAGCASKSSDVTASYVTPLQYQSFTCEQIGSEATRVSSRVAELSGVQDNKATNDAIVTGVAIVVFWPAAFLVNGDGQTAAELGRLKGEFQALEQASVQKSCGFQFQQQQPPPQQKPAPQQAETRS